MNFRVNESDIVVDDAIMAKARYIQLIGQVGKEGEVIPGIALIGAGGKIIKTVLAEAPIIKPAIPPVELAAHEFKGTLLNRVDGESPKGYPFWYGWALREAFLAGAKWAKDRGERPNTQCTPTATQPGIPPPCSG